MLIHVQFKVRKVQKCLTHFSWSNISSAHMDGFSSKLLCFYSTSSPSRRVKEYLKNQTFKNQCWAKKSYVFELFLIPNENASANIYECTQENMPCSWVDWIFRGYRGRSGSYWSCQKQLLISPNAFLCIILLVACPLCV